MTIRRVSAAAGLLALVVGAGWLAAFLWAPPRFTPDRRRELVTYAARRYLIFWVFQGPERARAGLRSFLRSYPFVESVSPDSGTAGFKVVFSDREEMTALLPALPETAFLPWWMWPVPFLLWAGMAWTKHRRQEAEGARGAGRGRKRQRKSF